MLRLGPRSYLVLAALASAAMLASAHAFERIGGYAPCLLCLRQREVYWIALTVSAGGLALLARNREPLLPRVLPLLLAAVFLTGFAVAVYHAGAEWKFWPGPTACAGGGSAGVADMEALLRGEGGSIVRCDEVVWSLAGLSMAGWNAVISMGLALAGAAAALSGLRRRSLGAAHAL
jgi:disulfide bond formation protein DsbB